MFNSHMIFFLLLSKLVLCARCTQSRFLPFGIIWNKIGFSPQRGFTPPVYLSITRTSNKYSQAPKKKKDKCSPVFTHSFFFIAGVFSSIGLIYMHMHPHTKWGPVKDFSNFFYLNLLCMLIFYAGK